MDKTLLIKPSKEELHMKKQIRLYNRLLRQYNRYRRKLNRILTGTSRYSRKALLIKRLNTILAQLQSLSRGIKVAGASAAISMGFLMASPTVGHSQDLQLKTDNPVGIANIENRAKPALLDWDGDGDLDLFVGGKVDNLVDSLSNGVLYFENNGGLMSQRPSPFPSDLGIAASLVDTGFVSPSFIDLDGDEDMDSFVGIVDGTMIYFRNDNGVMVRVDGMENPFDGIQIGGTTHASPTFVDVDGDGDMDAIIGKNDGLLSYYNNDGGVFTEVSSGSPFENVNVLEKAAPTFADWDGDGDMDLLVGNKDGSIDFYINTDGMYAAALPENNPFTHIAIEFNTAPAVGDMDGDSDLDLILGNDQGLLYYFRNDPDTLIQVSTNTIGLDYDAGIANVNHSFIDINGDGDMDIFTGELNGIVHHYENDAGSFAKVDPHPMDVNLIPPQPDGAVAGFVSAPSFADVDGDGDMDAFLGTYQNNIFYFSNTDGAFAADSMNNPFNGIDVGDDENIAFVDWDGDGDMDAFIGNKVGEVKYYQNDAGTFTAAVGPLDEVSFIGDRLPNWSTKPAFADVDADGDMDAYVGTLDGFIRVFNNDGAGALVEMTGADNPFDGMDFGRSAAPDFGDIDGDGDMDLVVGNANGLTFHFENAGSVAVKQISFSNATNVFPNPTMGSIQLSVPWIKGEAIVRVTNLAGQVLKQVSINSQNSNLDISFLPTGLYLVKINAANGEAVKKIMKG